MLLRPDKKSKSEGEIHGSESNSDREGISRGSFAAGPKGSKAMRRNLQLGCAILTLTVLTGATCSAQSQAPQRLSIKDAIQKGLQRNLRGLVAGTHIEEAAGTRERRAYEENKDRFRIPERVKVRHILLKTMDKPKEEIPKIQAKAEDRCGRC